MQQASGLCLPKPDCSILTSRGGKLTIGRETGVQNFALVTTERDRLLLGAKPPYPGYMVCTRRQQHVALRRHGDMPDPSGMRHDVGFYLLFPEIKDLDPALLAARDQS